MVLGTFYVPSQMKVYAYKPTSDVWAIANGYIHEIIPQSGGQSYLACVRTKRVKVVVGDVGHHVPDVDTWPIEEHMNFSSGPTLAEVKSD